MSGLDRRSMVKLIFSSSGPATRFWLRSTLLTVRRLTREAMSSSGSDWLFSISLISDRRVSMLFCSSNKVETWVRSGSSSSSPPAGFFSSSFFSSCWLMLLRGLENSGYLLTCQVGIYLNTGAVLTSWPVCSWEISPVLCQLCLGFSLILPLYSQYLSNPANQIFQLRTISLPGPALTWGRDMERTADTKTWVRRTLDFIILHCSDAQWLVSAQWSWGGGGRGTREPIKPVLGWRTKWRQTIRLLIVLALGGSRLKNNKYYWYK